MMVHKCDNCDKEFKLKTDLVRHNNRKFKCVSNKQVVNTIYMENNIDVLQKDVQEHIDPSELLNIAGILHTDALTCEYCQKKFTREDNLKKHKNERCKLKDIKIKLLSIIQKEREEKDQQQKELIKIIKEGQDNTNKKMELLENTISELKQSNTINNTVNTTNNTTNNNTFNNTVNNNIIIKFGTDVEQNILTFDELVRLLHENVAQIVPKMAEKYHFDINKPKYHNVYIPDKKSKFAVVFNGKQYVSDYLDDTIFTIDAKMKSHLSHFMRKLNMNEEQKQQISEDSMKRMIRQMKQLNDMEETDELQKRSNQYLKFTLFDNKEMIKNTRLRYETKYRKKKLANRTPHIVDT